MKYKLYVNDVDDEPIAIARGLSAEYFQMASELGIKVRLVAQSNSIDSLSVLTAMGKKITLIKQNLN